MKTLDTIDFSPLDSANVWRSAYWKTIRNKLVQLGFVLAAATTLFLAFQRQFSLSPVFGMGVLFFVLAFVQAAKEKERLWQEFAIRNGWEVLDVSLQSHYIPLAIKGIGHSPKVSKGIRAVINDEEWHVLTYTYTVGSGKNSRLYVCTVLHKPLAKHFPYIALDSRSNRGGIRRTPVGCRQISLEGDFDKYFSLFLQEGSHINVLSIITPDVMATLIDANQHYDIEILDDNLYVIAVNDQRSPEKIRSLFAASNLLLQEFKHKIKTLQYDPNLVRLGSVGKEVSAITAQTARYRTNIYTLENVIKIISVCVVIIIFCFVANSFFSK